MTMKVSLAPLVKCAPASPFHDMLEGLCPPVPLPMHATVTAGRCLLCCASDVVNSLE